MRLPLAVWSGLNEGRGEAQRAARSRRRFILRHQETETERESERERAREESMCAGGQHPLPRHCQPLVAAGVRAGVGVEKE